MADKEGTRKTAAAILVCSAPDVCKTPSGPSVVPVPYQITSLCSSATGEVTSVRMTGIPCLNLDSKLSTVIGDEPGVAGGVKSGVNKSICEFISGSSTVNASGKPVIRHDDPAKMNNGNTIGKIVYPLASSTSTAEAKGAEKPSIDKDGNLTGDTEGSAAPETAAESGFVDQFEKRFDELKEDYKGMFGTARDAVGLGDDGSFDTAWGKIWGGTKALGSLGLDAVTVGIDNMPGTTGMLGVGEMLNPGAADRLKAVGSSMVEGVKGDYTAAYNEGGVPGALGRLSMDGINIVAQALTAKGVGKVVEAGSGAIKGAGVLEGAASKIDDVAKAEGALSKGATKSAEAANKVDDVAKAKTPDVPEGKGGGGGAKDGVQVNAVGVKAISRAEVKTALEARYPRKVGEELADYEARITSQMESIDWSKSVEEVTLQPGDQVDMWVRNGGMPGGYGTTPGTSQGLGITMDPATGLPAERHLESFIVQEPISVIKSTAADFPDGKFSDVGGGGGGIQYHLPGDFLGKTKPKL